ncbi:hypothetical protein [Streptomyces sp. NPDC058683]|uniref:nSTAND1 domain-containing NTPase n=1 Tax=Streptomyces sp. NPDC058683 TaxID=3346597 RepID=UPI0036621A72
MHPPFQESVAQVLGHDGTVAGAGFLVADDTLATCAHVVRMAGSGPGRPIALAFPHADGRPRPTGLVLPDAWRDPEAEDIAIVRLDSPVTSVPVLPLGFSDGCRSHSVRSFGFPPQALSGGHFGTAVAGDVITYDRVGPVLQLTDANDLTTGFSGGPVVDDATGRVIGMITSIVVPDAHRRGQNIAYATAVQALRRAWTEFAVADECPYPGLEPFGKEQAGWFHGRDRAVDAVLDALAEQAGRGSGVLLLGPSGSGKSSLVRAGVLPALEAARRPGSDRWLPVMVRSGLDLIAELGLEPSAGARAGGLTEAVRGRLGAEPGHDRILLVVDHFEELLFDSSDAVELLTEAIGSVPALTVLLVVRDDFYPRLAASAPRLLEKLRHGVVNVPATLDRRELYDIVTRPATAVGARFEGDLAQLIVADLVTGSAGRGTAGAAPVTLLPALQLALNRLWQRLDESGCLTHAAYRDIGKVTGALRLWCQDSIDALPTEHRPVAQRLLTALVRPADDERQIPAVRQRVPLAVLRELEEDADDVVAELARRRVVSTGRRRSAGRPDDGEPVAELIHDALIRDWPALGDWIARDHRFHDWLRRADERRARWADRQHRHDDLLDGSDLAEGLEWAVERRLPERTAAYLSTSAAHRRARLRRARRLNAFLGGALVLAVLAASLAFAQRQHALDAERLAQARQLTTQSRTLSDSEPDLAALLAVQAYRTKDTPESRAALYAAAGLPLERRLPDAGGTMALSPDGRTLATASTGGPSVLPAGAATNGGPTQRPLTLTRPGTSVTRPADTPPRGSGTTEVELWDLASGRRRVLSVESGPNDTGSGTADSSATALAFAPDGRTLAVGGPDRVSLVNVRTGRTAAVSLPLPSGADPRVLGFTPDGRTLAALGRDDRARTWDVATGAVRANFSTAVPTSGLPLNDPAAVVGPDGRTLATSGNGAGVVLLDLASGRKRTVAAGPDGTAGVVTSLAFARDGGTLAAGSTSGRVSLVDVRTGRVRATFSGPDVSVGGLAFAPDGRTVASLAYDTSVRLWDVPARKLRSSFPSSHTADMTYGMAFGPDGRTLVTSDGDEARVWKLDGLQPYALTTPSLGSTGDFRLGFDRRGRNLVGGGEQETRVWDATTGEPRAVYDSLALRATPVYDDDGHPLTVTTDEEGWAVRDVVTGAKRAFGTSPSGSPHAVLSPDGGTVALPGDGDRDGVTVLDTATGANRSAPDLAKGHPDLRYPLLLSRGGTTLAAVDGRATRVWDTASGDLLTTLDPTAGGPLDFSPDSRVLATAGHGDGVQLRDVATGRSLRTLDARDGVLAAVFSPDGRFLAIGGRSGVVQVWETATGRSRQVLTGSLGRVAALAFGAEGPEGYRLAVGGKAGGVELWQVSLPGPREAVEKICGAVHRDLTESERAAYLPDPSAPGPCHP